MTRPRAASVLLSVLVCVAADAQALAPLAQAEAQAEATLNARVEALVANMTVAEKGALCYSALPFTLVAMDAVCASAV